MNIILLVYVYTLPDRDDLIDPSNINPKESTWRKANQFLTYYDSRRDCIAALAQFPRKKVKLQSSAYSGMEGIQKEHPNLQAKATETYSIIMRLSTCAFDFSSAANVSALRFWATLFLSIIPRAILPAVLVRFCKSM